LAGIGAALGEATAAAAAPTTAIAAAGADDVSAAIVRVFGSYGHEFQAVGIQASAFHQDFVNLLKSGAGAYWFPACCVRLRYSRSQSRSPRSA
jgi:hypothetical protein